jgi:hypothetical protein
MEYLQEYEERESAEEEALVEELISDWTFFEISSDLTKTILALNDELGSDYFRSEYDKLTTQGGEDSDYEDLVEDTDSLNEQSQQVSEILVHDEKRAEQSEDEMASFFQAFLSERIFNHLAMLSRSRHARKGKTFSIREELTKEIAEKIGLGLSLRHETPSALRSKTEKALIALAFEFQCWLTEKHRGVFFTTWGSIYSVKKKRAFDDDSENILILEPDVEPRQAFLIEKEQRRYVARCLPEVMKRT